ncbi:histidine kinase [Paramagnetospirillum marisnigri]|uniref:histidine kinase n=1 Tax=Paramagnetospirillum marisnigri TaxID=1285242 RepID=A0A178MH68_9PROT|nr:sensor histidine kinase [Paramagnetospirillum marisnigri]OAN48031.1 histidine kinase [Paramagnetospirillum marisnigri]
MSAGLLAIVSLLYLLVLFAIAYGGDRRTGAMRGGPWVYSLSLAVYCTSWTFFGSVGLASQRGLMFLPIYLGPTLMAALWPMVVGRMIRIGRAERITSIADFISSRYGKSHAVGALVTVIAVIGIVPYISLQLKAVSDTFLLLVSHGLPQPSTRSLPVLLDTAFHVTLILAVFSILFGARHIDASEHHRGMVDAIAFESVVKLVAFLLVGGLVTFGFHDGFADLFERAAARPDLARLFTFSGAGDYGTWISLTLLSMMAIICLPRQFQVAVVENVDESHARRAAWLFPLYLILINLFVLPIALAGRLAFEGQGVDPDTYVLALPLAQDAPIFAAIAFLGGLSAATGMVIVETVALATMFSNSIAMPLLVRGSMTLYRGRESLSGVVLAIRRLAIAGFLLLGYVYARLTGENFTLVGIGLMSFTAVAQFAPVLLGGLFWRGGSRAGALAGLSAGFLVWVYTLFLPSLARSGVLASDFVELGPFGLALLKPGALFGLTGLEAVPHALMWSMMANIGAYVLVSLVTEQSAIERIQASVFTDRFTNVPGGASQFWRGQATVADLQALAARFVGAEHAESAFSAFLNGGRREAARDEADPELVEFTERLLAGAIGTATARVVVASVTKGEIVSLNEVMEILDENSQVIAYSHKLEQKSRELETTTAELRSAYEKLSDLSRLKDEFIATVTHELRTPLTSIRSFTEILHDNPDVDLAQRQEFLGIVIKESERLTRLINQVLDLAKLEAGTGDWEMVETDLATLIHEAAAGVGQLYKDKRVTLELALPPEPVRLATDRDRFSQVVINLLSNAVKFCEADSGEVRVRLADEGDSVTVSVSDNGPGIPDWALEKVFDKFQQVGDTMTSKPSGTGLGLTISRNIIEHLGGRIWVDSQPGRGACFAFRLPRPNGSVGPGTTS